MYGTYLAHHGIKGQRWGVRRYQNEDGTLTEAGKRRYYVDSNGEMKKIPSAKILKQEIDSNRKAYAGSGKAKDYQQKLTEAANNAIKIGKQYGLDLDDGGGGSEAAQREYQLAWDRYNALAKQYNAYSKAYAEEKLIAKYGSTSIDKINRHDQLVGVAAVTATSLAIPLAAIGLASYISSR